MEQSFTYPTTLGKDELYKAFLADYTLYIEGETDLISTFANTSAALREAFGFFWVGFYIVHDNEWLHLGPFQGTAACTRIRRGRGVCGTAWDNDHTLVVSDVELFPGHIACSSASRSEVVIPVHDKQTGAIIAVLDIDSTSLNAFPDELVEMLEAVVQALQSLTFC